MLLLFSSAFNSLIRFNANAVGSDLKTPIDELFLAVLIDVKSTNYMVRINIKILSTYPINKMRNAFLL